MGSTSRSVSTSVAPREAARASVLCRAEEKRSPEPAIRSLVQDHFGGTYCTHTRCLSCHFSFPSSSNRIRFDVLNLPLKPTLQEALDVITSEESLLGENQCMCDRCGSKQDASRRIRYTQLPRVLCLQLNRFESRVRGSAPACPVAWRGSSSRIS